MPSRLYASDPRWPRMDALAMLAAILANPTVHLGEYIDLLSPARRAEFALVLDETRAKVREAMQAEIDSDSPTR